jgi:beta-glucosidase-like glycosyl hydrolase
MTVEEKVGQLSLYGPADTNIPGNPQAAQRNGQQEIDDVRAGRLTGLFNNQGLERKRVLQEVAVRESRLGIPLLYGADVIHGFRTIFPMPLAEAASWEPELAERTARAAAVEASADGFRWTFAPMVDIARDARWGRGIEGAGEDVYLANQFAAARVRGFQGNDLSRGDALLATPKHFAAYGAAEGGLDYAATDISERTPRQVYLPPFRAAVDAGALSMMSAFNEISGIPSIANPALLTGVLRDEWKFKGFVVSDYTADEELIAHGYAANGREAAKQSFLAGTDVSMQSGLYMRYLPELVASGEVPMARLDDAVRRVLWVKQKLGLFDQPLRGLDGPPAQARTENPAHIALAREDARRSIVMLKNERAVLPLPRSGKKIALIGPFASGTQDLLGAWSLFPGQSAPVGIEDGLRAALRDPAALTVVRGSGIESPLAGGIEAAVSAARDADVVVLAIGEGQLMSGEARSRTDIGIPQAQQDLARSGGRDRQARGRAAEQRPRHGTPGRGAQRRRDSCHLVSRRADGLRHRRRGVRRLQPIGPAAGELSANIGTGALLLWAEAHRPPVARQRPGHGLQDPLRGHHEPGALSLRPWHWLCTGALRQRGTERGPAGAGRHTARARHRHQHRPARGRGSGAALCRRTRRKRDAACARTQELPQGAHRTRCVEGGGVHAAHRRTAIHRPRHEADGRTR